MDLLQYGWNDRREADFAPFSADGASPGRVISQKSSLEVITTDGILRCHPSGRLKFRAGGTEELPAVGDWVAVRGQPAEGKGSVIGILPRSTCFLRKVPGETTRAQVLAANVDIVFLVSGLDDEFNPARIERYLVLARESGAVPILLLNKGDLCVDAGAILAAAADAAPGIRCILTSVVDGNGLEEVRRSLPPGQTAALLGSSGVGKSSILNMLLGQDLMRVGDVRSGGSEGRHTTTHRELVLLPGGGMLIDTPGMRELQVWGDGSGLEAAFDDVEQIALQCKFRDCRHEEEPGCAVRAALEQGALTADRLESYMKMQREFAHLRRKHDVHERIAHEKEIKRRMWAYKKDQRRRDRS